ncbi:hypothetical protein H5410_024183 [Solanum commersonii]|uniref:Uncharacterized protein n=1 Tax=Solanum commersonii TaxID=4109 RepID=A0A9J5ZLB2_SOLCO|nr:hypothetical protein H5410_024183 [Solanum commersonii]
MTEWHRKKARNRSEVTQPRGKERRSETLCDFFRRVRLACFAFTTLPGQVKDRNENGKGARQTKNVVVSWDAICQAGQRKSLDPN